MTELLDGRLIVETGDITRQQVDAVVNAANSTLLGGGGVDGAIHRAAGPALLEECRRLRESSLPDGLPPGEAVVTGSGNLPAGHVIHTVGPVWHGGASGEDDVLASAYRNCLRLAAERQFSTIAFPAVSTGVYGFPRDRAAAIAYREITTHLDHNELPQTVRLVFFSGDDARVFLDTVG